ncbi:hypothetical protein B0O80DRAFT_499454 [Mortierella sp. GBAus27b]|nr:hypothetical protein BGX31_000431 [Mortierella sp. GBA43]KAI8352767.1 hypothetical protein B0O80DRAFT_499454 [Mortierella sp. GBAus27b]
MITFTRALSFATVLAYASTSLADVWISHPIADTQWKIGAPAEIRWRLTSPTSKQDVATVYLVGGDYTAYKRLETLGKDVVLGDHKLAIPKVPSVDCGSSCAVEFWINDGPGKGDHYSHTFTLSNSGAAPANSSTSASGTKSTPGGTSNVQNGAATNGPNTTAQGTTKGTQPETTSNANVNAGKGSMTLVMTAVSGVAVATMSLFL